MIYGITLIILGILAAPSLLLAKKPNAQELLDKITPYQGWIGLAFCFWGIWGVIQAVLNMSMLTTWPIWWITWLASSAVEAVLGFILGYGMISRLILSKNEEAKKKGEALLAKLAPMQGKLGLVGICVGAWVIVASILFY
ncbi:hypothetical protein N6H18_11300 [Reichenbachiella agarivorans]|uniref:Uncharacterized protein n=1 Tax=Reichenbachiella agarivorans TaxID=2979464 RepID=A0ABY6CK92_9BACT|nr:hypothetical protein [Reichenbachiella agarivorans]UXP30937.1 hypothetical protein N6H18_11300 [Reichenbachiella agarivorans]